MGKYYSFKHDYDAEPISKENFTKALRRIGQKDPKEVIVTKLGGKKPALGAQLTDKEYINRGILNIRKSLNGHLGLSGKYTNRMIRLSSTVDKLKSDSGTVWLKSKLPKKDYIKIVEATYKLLEKCDKQLCKDLLNAEKQDKYIQQGYYKAKCYKTIAPIQTNMIIRTAVGKTERITAFAQDFREYIGRMR